MVVIVWGDLFNVSAKLNSLIAGGGKTIGDILVSSPLFLLMNYV